MNFLRTSATDETVAAEAVFGISPARLFRAWTDPVEVVQWFGHRANGLVSAEIDLRVGGAWRFVLSQTTDQLRYFGGEYLDVDPDSLLVFSWSYIVEVQGVERKATPRSRVTVRFEDLSGRTRVRLVHEGIRSADARLNVGGGWEAGFRRLGELVVS